MGGKPQQVNSGQASSAFSGASASANSAIDFANQNKGWANQDRDIMFGNGSPLVDFASGKNLRENEAHSDQLDPVRRMQFQAGVDQQERESSNARRGIFSTVANRGFGMDSGAASDYMRQNALETANARGQGYTQLAGQQHDEALNNFWNAQNVVAGDANSARGGATSNYGTAASTYSNLYGTAGQQARPNSLVPTIIGSGLQAGGAVGAAAMCPAEDAKIKTPEGERVVQSLKKGDRITQQGEVSAPLACDPIPVHNMALALVRTINGKGGNVSHSHAFVRADSGYANAHEALGKVVKTDDGDAVVNTVYDAGAGTVYVIVTEGNTNRTLCVDGIWSLE